MRAIVRTVQGLLADNAAQAGLNQSDLQALIRIVDAGGLSGAEVGRILDMTSSSTTELADRLENAGMIRRTRSARDRRLVLLKPTARGKRAVERALGPTLAAIRGLLGELSDVELITVQHFIDRVEARLSELAEQ